MKQWIFFIIILIVASVSVLLILNSRPKVATSGVFIRSSLNGTYATFADQQVWSNWFRNRFVISNRLLNTINITIHSGSESYESSILLVALAPDSVAAQWQCKVRPGTFASRLRPGGSAASVERMMNDALQRFNAYCEDTRNVYGLSISQTSTRDTYLLARKFSANTYPSTVLVYRHIEAIRQVARAQGATEAGPPMLNVTTTDSIHFRCMVALPVDRTVPVPAFAEDTAVFFVRMVPGRFLTTEIRGGPATIRAGHRTMQRYFHDFKRTAMAIPFEYLVTNRVAEPDTSRWVTRIYAPVY